ncbi:DJ-1/PfpI family protein [Variovorax sp. efr-133-TYG-130]|jgi:transcriptional regulator GlxA family with amidase domain|uniref:GlxA family transcriptional regulator n=1 Tax=Variovorax sp. efr-133-TYG-130 TaxID=3040327 RepID=UPI0025545D08|nr:DJ-1/PfpI family protein [Variovorax sp. efr-133-TYG-130]
MTRFVSFLLVPEFQLFDMAGPLSVFQVAAEIGRGRRGPAYEIAVFSERGGRVACSAGLEMQTRSWRDSQAGTVIVPGGQGARKPGAATPALVQHLRAALAAKRRVASVCTGAFLLAEAGLLDGRRATTHWRQAALLQRNYPAITVDADRIFVRDGHVWSSAGIAAGIDLALALVEADLGADIAGAVAREMVVYHRRTGGQSQFSALQDLAPQSERMRAVLAHIGENLTADLDIDRLAEVACVSPRQFMRTFKAETGQTPAKAVERIRAEVARTHIEGGDSSIEAVARLTGFEDPERMRRAFVRVYGQPPQALRRMARAAAPAGAPRA